MRRVGALVLVLVATSGVGGDAQEAAAPRTFLLFVDDLHIHFQNTPQLRGLLLRMIDAVTRDGDRWAIVTTGTSSVSERPTSDRAVLTTATRRITGNALPAASAVEPRHRASVSLSTAREAIEAISTRSSNRPFAVVYVSNGYDRAVAAESAALIEAAETARAQVYVVDPRGLSNAGPLSGVAPTDWAEHLSATRPILSALASRTRGMTAFTDSEVDTMVTRLAGWGP